MNHTFVTRIAGISALLAVVAQFAAIAMAAIVGIRPGTAIDFSNGAQLLAANANLSASVSGLALATISPFLALPLGLGLYVVLKEAKSYALFGAVMFYVAMTIGLVHEVLRITMFARLPVAYLAASESVRPAVLVLGDVVQYAEGMFAFMSFLVLFGLSFSGFALAILRLSIVPRWLGWTLLIPAVGVGLVSYPLSYFGVAIAGMMILPLMMVFFVWLAAIGIVLLRWRPQGEAQLGYVAKVA